MTMQLQQFIAESAVDAVAQIRSKLGTDAVVVNVRQLPRRLWKGPRIEVLAHKPQPEGNESADISQAELIGADEALPPHVEERGNGWHVWSLLQRLGFLPLYAELVVGELRMTYGATPPGSLAQELQLTRGVLQQMWPRCAGATLGLHVLIGSPGVGKTTVLCKWLTQSVLLGGRTARVWRLDGRTANTAELLSVHGDILGVPLERSWTGESIAEELAFVDLPGVTSVEDIKEPLEHLSNAQVHLVLNAAYETSLLLAQVRAFSTLPISDLIVTHLDEVSRWGKLWNLALGSGYPIRFLSAGQNIPGEFFDATAERLMAHDLPLK